MPTMHTDYTMHTDFGLLTTWCDVDCVSLCIVRANRNSSVYSLGLRVHFLVLPTHCGTQLG